MIYKKVKSKSADQSMAYNAMLKLLTKREYASFELKHKLSNKYTIEAIDKALASLQEKNYQSDDRYCQMILDHMVFTYYGPRKYVSYCVKNHISADIYKKYIFKVNWDKIALLLLKKKYNSKNLTKEEKIKALSFLFRRGFLSENCKHAIRMFSEQVSIDE